MIEPSEATFWRAILDHLQDPDWLPLTDYSSKYRVSISTLRRRIKHGQVQYRFEDGKYLLHDQPPRQTETHPAHKMGVGAEAMPSVVAAAMSAQPVSEVRSLESLSTSASSEEPILSSATRLLSELKRAYMNILHEKEEQIIQLKEEVVDLKTLVRVLEDDNDRMRAILSSRGN